MTQLTLIAPERLGDALDAFGRGVADDALSAAAFTAIRASVGRCDGERALARTARAMARGLAIPLIDEEPATAFSWDGRSLRARSEPCVLFHEIAHWLLAPPPRRALPDFGLGAGPESGCKAEADRARVVDEETRSAEECAASLLGILLEATAGGPAIEAFLEQNWLERFDSEGTHRLFSTTLADLRRRGLIDGVARPLPPAPNHGVLRSSAHTLVLAGAG
jgi:hypothetical protein